MTIVAQAPCRISLVGGGTDVDPFAAKYGGQVLNLAVSLYHTATLVPHSAKTITVTALGKTLTLASAAKKLTYGLDPQFDLVRAIINHFRSKLPSGFSLIVSGPDKVLGLGRSGSAAVAMIAAFDAWLNTRLSRQQIALLAADLEIKELGWSGGRQDSFAAAFGGINLINFGPGKKIIVSAVKLTPAKIKALSQWTFMVCVGGHHYSYHQQTNLIQGMADARKIAALQALKQSVPIAVKALKAAAWPALGKIIHQAWEDKKKSNPIVTNKFIDQVYDRALAAGALGGKVAGSGGAGNMFFIIPPAKKHAAITAITQLGAKVVPFNFDFQGVRVSYAH